MYVKIDYWHNLKKFFRQYTLVIHLHVNIAESIYLFLVIDERDFLLKYVY